MTKNNVVKLVGRDTIIDPLTELLRTGAERLIYQSFEVELLELLAEYSERGREDGKAGVVRNGHLPAHKLQTGLGPVTVEIPKVRAKTGEPVTFRPALVPSYVRKTKSLEAALPKDREELMALYDIPAQHWQSILKWTPDSRQ